MVRAAIREHERRQSRCLGGPNPFSPPTESFQCPPTEHKQGPETPSICKLPAGFNITLVLKYFDKLSPLMMQEPGRG